MERSSGKTKPSTLLAPGFRFHPTDEELVQYYLRRKVCGKSFRFDAISDVDVYKAEPWDLPYKAKLKSRDLEWYFFSVLDKKYGNGARTNRATEKGYWKTTGKDRAVHHKMQVVGMKKTLVYHCGRAPKGQRTNWVMHEYRRVDNELETAGTSQDAFVLCRVFQKSGTGPKNGEQYGAPFVEEEWEDDEELELVPESDDIRKVNSDYDACLDYKDLQQILESDIPSNDAPILTNFQTADSIVEVTEPYNNMPAHLVPVENQYSEPALCFNDVNTSDLPSSYHTDAKPVDEFIRGKFSKSGNLGDMDFSLDEQFLDFPDDLQFTNEGFIEANDLTKPVETDSTASDMLEEYLTFFDANGDDNSLWNYQDLLSDQTFSPQEMSNGIEQTVFPNWPLVEDFNGDSSGPAVSSDKQELAKPESGFTFPYMKRASQMLGNTTAPPAFAAEYPSEEAIHRLNSLLQASSSYHVTSSMVQIRNGSSGKHDNLDILVSFDLSQRNNAPNVSGKSTSRGWIYFAFFWVLVLYMSFEIGTYIYAH